jgi:hypothetical protein
LVLSENLSVPLPDTADRFMVKVKSFNHKVYKAAQRKNSTGNPFLDKPKNIKP